DNTPIKSQVFYRYFDKKAKKLRKLKEFNEVSAGDHFVTTLKNSKDCYVYIFNIDSNYKLNFLFPNQNIALKNPMYAEEFYTFPPEADDYRLIYGFDKTEGLETFYIFVSVTPLTYIEDLIKNTPKTGYKLDKEDQVIKKIEELYKKSRKRIRKDENSSNSVWFADYYARKIILIRGLKGRMMIALGNYRTEDGKRVILGDKSKEIGTPLSYKLVTLLEKEEKYNLVTTKDGVIYINLSSRKKNELFRGKGIITVHYFGTILKASVPLYDMPMRYKLTIIDEDGGGEGDEGNKYSLHIKAIFPFKN
ncbi:MAG: DUF4384 domain-containing protein, partial [Spirochaetota bacterium]|nr:DUF4384 domain-containing protein [Spirochaetota bacterium]